MPNETTNSQNKQSQSNTAAQSSTNNSSGPTDTPSKYKIVKDGWGSRTNFQLSYGLGMDPDGLEEGNRILEQFQKIESEERRSK